MTKDILFFLIGMLFLSGGNYRNSDNYNNTDADDTSDSNDSRAFNSCYSRMEKLEERLDSLESSQALIQDQIDLSGSQLINVPSQSLNRGEPTLKSSREEIFNVGECSMWVENNQVFFKGCNVHIVNSMGINGTVDYGDGLGNLIIGSNTCPSTSQFCDAQNPGYPNDGSNVDANRLGSHNIIVGNRHIWTGDAINSVIFGLENTIAGANTAILGGKLNTVKGSQNTVMGGQENFIDSYSLSTTISGGLRNKFSSAQFSSIVGGNSNRISQSNYNSIVGGAGNEITGNNSAIVGGTDNMVISEDSSILGGNGNITQGKGSVIVSGENNITQGLRAVILGGRRNFAGGQFSSVLNGYLNNAAGKHAVVSTGYFNAAKGDYSYIATGGGGNCQEYDNWIWCLQRFGNTTEGKYSSILGGASNKTIGPYSSIISGSNNTTPGNSAVVVGGGPEAKILSLMFPSYDGNSATGNFSVVVGGLSNKSIGNSSAILGGGNNETHGRGSAVCGGGGVILDTGDEHPYNPGNFAYGDFSLVAGGEHNWAGTWYKDENDVFHLTGDNAVAVGGKDNGAYAPRSCAVGGRGNFIDYGEMGSTFGGAWNQVSGHLSVIVGGKKNVSAGYANLVSGGMHNWTFDYVSAIFGGLFNVAGVPINGNYPFKLDNIDTAIVNDRTGMTTVGGYRNRAFDNISTVVGGTRNVAGHVPQNEDYCVQCVSCFNLPSVFVYDNSPLENDIYRDCSCQQECYTTNMTTSAATVTGGHDNHLASYLQNALYYPWIAGHGFEYSYLGSGAQ